MKIEDIKVIVINKQALDDFIDATIKTDLAKCVDSDLAPKLKKGESFRTRTDKLAIISDTNIVTNDECIYNIDKGEGIKLDIFSEFEAVVNEDGGTSKAFSVFPTYSMRFSIEELKEYSTETIDLPSFMGKRFNYNNRIEDNQDRLLEILK